MIHPFGRWPVFYKIFIPMLLIVVLVAGILTFAHITVLRARMKERIGENIADLADAQMKYVVSILNEQFTLLQGITVDTAVVSAVEAANVSYTGAAAEIASTLSEINRLWLIAADSSPVVQARIDPVVNPAAAQLLVYARTFPAFSEFVLTDRYGGLVAATGHVPYFVYADEAWWRAAYAEGRGAFYISQPFYEQRVGHVVLTIAVPVFAPQSGTVSGVLRAMINVQILTSAFETLPPEQNWAVTLVDEQRLILADLDAQRVGKSVPLSWPLYTVGTRGMWFEGVDAGGKSVVVGRALLSGVPIADARVAEAIHTLNWYLYVYQPQTEAYARMRGTTWMAVVVLALTLLVAAGALGWTTRSLTVPVVQLCQVARRWLAGDSSQRAWVYWHDEVGEIAEVFNTLNMTIHDLKESLARRARERELEQKRRARDLDATTAVGEAISATEEIPALSQSVIDLLRERFGLYYAGLYLLDDTGKWVVLQAASGDPARQLLTQDYRVAVGDWAVGRCVAEGKTIIARHTDADSVFLFDRSQFLYTRSVVAMPLRSRGQIFGAIEAHSYQLDTFSTDEAGEVSPVVLQTIADQIAVAIDSLRLYAERQETIESLRRVYSQVTREAWESLAPGSAGSPTGYQAESRYIVPLAAEPPEMWPATARHAWSEGRMVVEGSGSAEAAVLALPIRLRDEIIGVVDVRKRGDAGEWKPDEIAQLEQLVGQLGLTLEISRFYQESRRTAAREQLLREISERIRAAVDVDTVMRIAAQEVGAVLKRPVFVYMEHEAADEGRTIDE